MAAYVLFNKSIYDISLDLYSPVLNAAHSVVLPRGGSIDILPFMGSVAACKQIPALKKYAAIGYVLIEET
jgi:hypothetical protein